MIRRPSPCRFLALASTATLLAAACPPASPSAFAASASLSPAPPSPSCAATLAEVLELVRNGPRARAAREEAAAASGLVRQAGTRLNPEIAVEVEDFTGSGSYTELGQTQTTVSFAQRLELGGVRARRADLAEREGRTTVSRGAEETLAATVTAKQRFVDLLASRQRIAIAAEGERLAHEVLTAAQHRRSAGAGSAADEERARIAVGQASLLGIQARRDEKIAVQRLAGLWGGDEEQAACVGGSLPPLVATPPPDRDRSSDSPRSPSVITAEAEVEAGRAAVDFAKASAAPDLEFGAGLRHLAGPGEVSAVAGLRIEVPLFDRKDGAIDAAERKLLAAQARAGAAHREAVARRARLAGSLAASAAELTLLDRTMLPAAERAWTVLSQAWQRGAASALDVLDARRSLVDLRLQRLAALRDGLVTGASLEGTFGQVTDTLVSTPTSPAARQHGAAGNKD